MAPVRKRPRNVSRAAPSAFVQTATRAALSLATRTITATLAKKEGPSAAITQQHDSKTLYRRKRAPARVRKRARQAYARFLKNQLKAIAMQTQTFDLRHSHSSVGNYQGHSYMISGAFQSPQSSYETCGSLYEMAQNSLNSAPEDTNFRMYLHGMRSDYTIVNTSAGTIELDIYSFVLRRDLEHESASVSLTLTRDWEALEYLEQGKLPGATNTDHPNNITYTPFSNGALCRHIVITKKQRYYVSPGQAVSFVDRHVFRKPKQISGDKFSTPSNYFFHYIPGVTRGLYVVHKGLPSGSNDGGDASSIQFANQTTYRFKVLEDSKERNATGY